MGVDEMSMGMRGESGSRLQGGTIHIVVVYAAQMVCKVHDYMREDARRQVRKQWTMDKGQRTRALNGV